MPSMRCATDEGSYSRGTRAGIDTCTHPLSLAFTPFPTFHTACQVRCTASMTAQQCTRQLDKEGFAAFTVFFANVHTLCVFVQVRHH